MPAIRIIAKGNFLASSLLLLAWTFYRLSKGLPIEPHFPHGIGLDWLNILIWVGVLTYLFCFDRRMNEALVRILGIVLLFGFVMIVFPPILQQQINDSSIHEGVPAFYAYFKLSSALCALLGRRSLTKPELDRISALFGN